MSEQNKFDRRDVLGKIAKFGALASTVVAGACARKPNDAFNKPLSPYEPRRGLHIVKYIEESVVVEDYATGNQYLVTMTRPASSGRPPRMECTRAERRPGAKTTVLPGLFNSLLDKAHDATQSFQVGTCPFFFKVTQPLLNAFTDSITQGIAELNKYEIDKRIYGSTDENSVTIRAAEDPNRIIVIVPYYVQRSNLLNRLIHRSTTPGQKGPKPTGLA